MRTVLSLLTTLILLGVVFSLLHRVIVYLELADIFALLLFAAPLAIYFAYCTEQSVAAMIRSAIRIYTTFTAVVLSAVGLVYVIGI